MKLELTSWGTFGKKRKFQRLYIFEKRKNEQILQSFDPLINTWKNHQPEIGFEHFARKVFLILLKDTTRSEKFIFHFFVVFIINTPKKENLLKFHNMNWSFCEFWDKFNFFCGRCSSHPQSEPLMESETRMTLEQRRRLMQQLQKVSVLQLLNEESFWISSFDTILRVVFFLCSNQRPYIRLVRHASCLLLRTSPQTAS